MCVKNINPETLKQALANMRLESLSLSPEVDALVQRALTEQDIDIEDIRSLLAKPYGKDKQR